MNKTAIKTPQVLILAGGAGKRFWPLSKPKFLFEFLGQPLIVHNLQKLAKAGFSRAIIVTNPKDYQAVEKLKLPGLNLHLTVQKKPLGMADAVVAAEDLIEATAPLLIINAEDVVDQSLYTQLFQNLQAGNNFICGHQVDRYFPGGYLSLAGKKVVEIVEKPGAGNQPSNLVNLVFHGFQQPAKFLKLLKQTTSNHDDIYEVALSKMLKQNHFQVIRYTGPWQATKYPWHILEMMDLFLADLTPTISDKAYVSDKAVVEGKVVIEDQVKIFENAVVKGPAYIGAGSVIGTGALLRQSMIGANCVVGYNTEVARSWVGRDCWFHTNYVGDSVLEENVALGSGVVLANLRLDEGQIYSQVKGERVSCGRNKLGSIIASGVRVGVNTSIMPGIKIGSNTFVNSGLVVEKDIPDDSFASGQPLKIVKNRETPEASARAKFKKKL